MNSLLRLTSYAALLALFLVGLFAFVPELDEVPGLNLGEWLRCQRVLESEAERGEELERKQGRAIERTHAKNAIVRDLIAGRRSLAETVVRFGDLPFAPPNMWELLHRYYGGASHTEDMARHVIDWACQLVEDDSARAALRARLEAELPALPRDDGDRS